jgi:hypothetical protein
MQMHILAWIYPGNYYCWCHQLPLMHKLVHTGGRDNGGYTSCHKATHIEGVAGAVHLVRHHSAARDLHYWCHQLALMHTKRILCIGASNLRQFVHTGGRNNVIAILLSVTHIEGVAGAVHLVRHHRAAHDQCYWCNQLALKNTNQQIMIAGTINLL